MEKNVPNFLICGAAAGGTSFLSAGMMNHPEIYLPKKMRPEPHYFYKSWEYEKPFSYYLETYFKDVKTEKAIGERSSSYMFGPDVAQRTHKHLPNIKLIFMLRNPIERAWGNYRYTVIEGLEELSFLEVLEKEEERIKAQTGIWAEIQPHNYTGRGLYYKMLSKFLEYFPKEQMLMLKSELFGKNLQEDFKKVFRFLEVNENHTVVMPPSFTSLSVKDRKLQVELRKYFQNRFDFFVEATRREEDPIQYLEKNEDLKMFHQLKSNIKTEKESMPEDCRKYLQDFFRKDMEQLKTIIDFSIEDWK